MRTSVRDGAFAHGARQSHGGDELPPITIARPSASSTTCLCAAAVETSSETDRVRGCDGCGVHDVVRVTPRTGRPHTPPTRRMAKATLGVVLTVMATPGQPPRWLPGMVPNGSIVDLVVSRRLLDGDLEVDEVALSRAHSPQIGRPSSPVDPQPDRAQSARDRNERTRAAMGHLPRAASDCPHRWTELPVELRLPPASGASVTGWMSRRVPRRTGRSAQPSRAPLLRKRMILCRAQVAAAVRK